MKNEKYNITGMSCSACSARIEKTLQKLPGISTITVNLLTNSMQVSYDETILSSTEIIQAVIKAGYGASLPNTTKTEKNTLDTSAETTTMKHNLIGSVLFLLPLMYIAMHTMWYHLFGIPVPSIITQLFDGSKNALTYAYTQFLLLIPIMLYNKNYYRNGLRNLWHASPNMDSLVALGSLASTIFGIFAIYRIGIGLGTGNLPLVQTYSTNLYFESAGMIVTLVSIGKYLETLAKNKTGTAIKRLMDLSPQQATILRQNKAITIAIDKLQVGDLLQIKPGERIPADGIIQQGITTIDESALTGESMPVEKQVGDTVTSATLNKTGTIHVTAQRVGTDTTLQQIIQLMDAATTSKAPIAKIADTIAFYFVPIVIGIALIATAAWYFIMDATIEFSFSIGISILVISCPCALGLATPVAIMVGMGKGAESGILIKSGEALEIAHHVDTIVLDKTGTITTGTPTITDILPYSLDQNRLLSLAVGMEIGSEHPLGEAIRSYGKHHKITPTTVDTMKAIFGKGIEATIQDRIYYAGNTTLLQEKHLDLTSILPKIHQLSDEGKTPLIFASATQILGIIAVADPPKQTSESAINALKKLGLSIIMLTGDNQRTANALKKQLKIPRVIAEVLPQDKETHIAKLQSEGHVVAMIGDGINDAPALARADLGIALSAGTDIAMDSADAILIKNDLNDAVNVIRLSKCVLRNIKENLFWAFIYNIIGIPLAAGLLYPLCGIKLNPMIAAAAMSCSSICVVLNALRLRHFNTEHKL